MRITELLDKRSIRIDGAPKFKNEALDQMVELMAKSGKINDLEAYRQDGIACTNPFPKLSAAEPYL